MTRSVVLSLADVGSLKSDNSLLRVVNIIDYAGFATVVLNFGGATQDIF